MNANAQDTVLITGGTGMIGKALTARLLENNYRVVILTRDPKLPGSQSEHPLLSYAYWDPKKQVIDADAIGSADYIVHLAGANMGDKRWTARRKKQLVESRIGSGRLLTKSLTESKHHVKAMIAASAIGWYGPDPQVPNPRPFTEDDPFHEDFLGKTCRDWEASTEPVTKLGVRLVKLRTGIVLSNKGGVLPSFKRPVWFGLAPILGNGKQMISWIHISDIADMYLRAIRDNQMQGIYNAVAPFPVANKTLALSLARELKGRFFIPFHVPAFLLKWLFGEMSIEVLKSTTVSARRIRETGFTFAYPGLEAAIRDLAADPDR